MINVVLKETFKSAPYLAHFVGYPNESSSLSVVEPLSGKRMHWGYTGADGRVGAYERLREIFVLGIHPGNVGWPVAESWERQYNKDGKIPSTYTGSYRSDGTNLTP